MQNWSNTDTSLTVTTAAAGTVGSPAWDNIPAIVGYFGAGLATTNTDPQTVLGSNTAISLTANSSAGAIAGGLHEIANDTVAFQGSGSANAPHLVIYLNAAGRENVTFSCVLRELDNWEMRQTHEA